METMERERIEDIKGMTAAELVEFLREKEPCEILSNPYHSNPIGFDLYFVPNLFSVSSISNMEAIAFWAVAHRHAVQLIYDTFKKAIVVKLNRLCPEDTYQESEIIR